MNAEFPSDAQAARAPGLKGRSIIEVVLVFVLLRIFAMFRYAWLDRLGASFEVQRYVSGPEEVRREIGELLSLLRER